MQKKEVGQKMENSRFKFRAWIDSRKEMITPYFFVNDENFITQYGSSKPNAVMQYTGLKDKNGVEIYEGDIVSCEYLAPDERYVATGEVVWCNSDSAQYKVNDNFNESDPLQEWYSGCEVIGNIYENPELLKAPN